MQRRLTTQDISWLLDLSRNDQLDLDPPYQRRSVWTLKDRQFFLDTIFRNYPSPAIFLHKTIDSMGKSTYHVVDGKQRTETILDFVSDKLRISRAYGDVRLDGKKWSDLRGEQDLKQKFWNYQITVEMIDFIDANMVNEVFERLNRNSRKLTSQELRHAKFDGWLINEAEAEANREEWQDFGIVTRSRSKRMGDVQFISELMFVVLENRIMGFDQTQLDELYAKYDEPQETDPEFDEDVFRKEMDRIRTYMRDMERTSGVISEFAKALANFYSLWGLLALNSNLPNPEAFAQLYKTFMAKVDILNGQDDLGTFLQQSESEDYSIVYQYLENFRGANTDMGPREKRHQALQMSLLK
jgi:hypothetical protein